MARTRVSTSDDSFGEGQGLANISNTSTTNVGKNTSYEVRPDKIELNKIASLHQKEGKLIYDDTLKVLKYWNGVQWISATNSSGGGAGAINVVEKYIDLPSIEDASGLFYFVTNNQGTAWLPGSVGGQYYPAGLYYSNGIGWKYMNKTAYRDIDNYFSTSQTVDGNVVADAFIGDGSQLTNVVAVTETYFHDQGVPSQVWTVQHNLNKRPSVTVVDSAGSDVIGKISYINDNELTITFNASFSGSAYLN